MELSICQYASVHQIPLRTAYRHVRQRGRVADGDRIVRNGTRVLVACVHAGQGGNGTAEVDSCQPVSAKIGTNTRNNAGKPAPLDVLIHSLRRAGITDASRIERIVDDWTRLSSEVQAALAASSASLANFVRRHSLREVTLRDRVRGEGIRRQRLERGGCRFFARAQRLCRRLKDRSTGAPLQPSLTDCALCRCFKPRA